MWPATDLSVFVSCAIFDQIHLPFFGLRSWLGLPTPALEGNAVRPKAGSHYGVVPSGAPSPTGALERAEKKDTPRRHTTHNLGTETIIQRRYYP